jgi:hypothetical protein
VLRDNSSRAGRYGLQDSGFLDQIMAIFMDPLILIGTLWVIGIVIAVAIFRRSKKTKVSTKTKSKKRKKGSVKVKGYLMKPMRKMASEAEKGKKLSVPQVRRRDEIITEMFASKLTEIGIKPSTSSGHVPVSYTPFALFLKDHGVQDDIVGALMEGIMEEDSDETVRGIIDASSPELNLTGSELEKAKNLAVEEWRNIKKGAAS